MVHTNVSERRVSCGSCSHACYSNMPFLQNLVMGSNQFGGPLQDLFGGMQSLRFLDLSNNGFTGTVPPSLGILPSLGELLLNFNGFGEVVPQELCSITESPNNVLSADCLGTSPLITCSCCNVCCNALLNPPCAFVRRLEKARPTFVDYNHVPHANVPSTTVLKSDDFLKSNRAPHDPHRNLQLGCPGVSYLWNPLTGKLTANPPPEE